MIYALIAAICSVVGLIVGSVATHYLHNDGIVKGYDSRDEEVEGERDDAMILNSKIEEAAANRVADAQKMVTVMEQAANVLLRAAHTERAAADALEATSAQGKRLEEAVGLLRQTCESIDSAQGAILTALLNSGLMQGADIRRAAGRQVGEPDMSNPPPLVERDRGASLDSILR